MRRGDEFEVDPSALRATSAELDAHADQVGSMSEALAAKTGPAVGRGGIGGDVEMAVRRLIGLVVHDVGGAVRTYYRDVGAALRRAADETERRDLAVKEDLDRLARGRDAPARERALAGDGELPADVNGWRPTQRTLDYLGYSREQMGWWSRREALLGMTPAELREFRTSLLAALEDDGIPPATVDIRAHGSRANFYAGVHKTFDVDEPDAAEWFGAAPDRPQHHMVDSRYRLGLDDQRSDYDINLSSDAMVRKARDQYESMAAAGEPYEEFWATRRDGTPGHGFLNEALMKDTFPHLRAWADRWSGQDRLAAKVSWAVFGSSGPSAATASGRAVRFRDTDWMI